MKTRTPFQIFLVVALTLGLAGCTAKELNTAQGIHDQTQTKLTTAQPEIDALQASVNAQAAKVAALQAQLAATTQPAPADTAALASAQKQLAAEQTALKDTLAAKDALQSALDASNATIAKLKANDTGGAIIAATGPLAAVPVVGQYATLIGTIAAAGYGIYQQLQAKKANTNTQAIVSAVHNNTDVATHADIVAALPPDARIAYNDAKTAMGMPADPPATVAVLNVSPAKA